MRKPILAASLIFSTAFDAQKTLFADWLVTAIMKTGWNLYAHDYRDLVTSCC